MLEFSVNKIGITDLYKKHHVVLTCTDAMCSSSSGCIKTSFTSDLIHSSLVRTIPLSV